MAIDAEALKRNTDILTVIGHYVPLKKNGHHYRGLCPFHSETTPSYTVTPSKGFAHCYGCGRNHDVIGFIMDMLGIDFPAACAHLGANNDWAPSVSVPKAPRIPDRITSKPPPDEPTPSMALYNDGNPIEPSSVFPFRDVDGSLICYETRYPEPYSKSRMWSWGHVADRKPRWQCGHPNSPRPLYGLQRLGEMPAAPVLITEGPKKADAGYRLLGSTYVSLSWSGGANNVLAHNYELLAGKTVRLWPDADYQRCKSLADAKLYGCTMGDIIPYEFQPGQKAMFTLARKLLEIGCKVQVVDVSGREDGWDIADAEIEGWTAAEVAEWADDRARDYSLDALPPAKMNGVLHEINGQYYKEDGTLSPGQSSYLPKPPLPIPGSQAALVGSINFTMADDVEIEPIQWLWKGRLALGKISLLVGNPGLGKSQTCASITSILSTGGYWPDAVPAHERVRSVVGSTIILSSEDDPKDTVVPRLMAAGADRSKVALIDSISVRKNASDETPTERAFQVTTDLKELGAFMDMLGDVRLLIVDPISAYMGTADSYKEADVRSLLMPLQNMAHKRGFAVLLIAHLTKNQSGSALMRVQGSVALVATARAVWGINEDPDDPNRRIFVSMKANLSKPASGLGFTIESVEVPSKKGPVETSRVMWSDVALEITGEDGMNANAGTQEEQEEARDSNAFLKALLRDGPVRYIDVEKEAKGAGYSMITMNRAKKRLKVESEKTGSAVGAWVWFLKGHNRAPSPARNPYADRED